MKASIRLFWFVVALVAVVGPFVVAVTASGTSQAVIITGVVMGVAGIIGGSLWSWANAQAMYQSPRFTVQDSTWQILDDPMPQPETRQLVNRVGCDPGDECDCRRCTDD